MFYLFVGYFQGWLSIDRHLIKRFNVLQWDNGTKLTDLNVDCQLHILKELDFISLVNVAEVDEAYSALAADVFKRKFAHKIIELRETSSKNEVVELHDVIKIEKFNMISKVFNHFGHFISKVKLIYGRDQKYQSKLVFELVSHHSDNFIKFHIECYNEFLLQNVQKPFYNAENVSFAGEFYELGSESMKLNEMFPKMRQLSLGYLHVTDPTSIHLHFPYLEHLSVSFIRTKQPFTDTDIKCLINKNPQIQSLSIYHGSMEFFKFVSENMPNLNALYLPWKFSDYLNDRDRPIHFKTVKKLSIKYTINRFPRNVTFDKLQEMEFICNPDFPDVWINFIEKNTHLTRLNITNGEIYKIDLEKITSILPDLVEVSFICGLDIDIESIVKFLNLNTKLKKLNLKCDSNWLFREPRSKDIQTQIGWKVIQNPNNILFEKFND